LDVWEMNRPHLLVRRGSGAAAKAFQVAGQVEDGTFAFSMTFDVEQATWTHVVVTWDEPTRSGVIYLNDMPIRRLMLTSPFAPDGQLFRLGTNFVGGIDEVRLYDRALTATEVIEIR